MYHLPVESGSSIPRELWNIIYHFSDIETLTNLILNKQFYNELNQLSFWKLYIKVNELRNLIM